MIYVQGKNVNLYVLKGGSYVLAVCSTNISRRGTGATLPTLVRGAGSTRKFIPTLKEETITLDGLLTIDQPSQFQFYEFEIGSFYTVRIKYDDMSGNTIQLDGEVLITGIDDNNGAADFSTWSISMVRNGVWSMTGTGAADTTPPSVVSARAIGPHTVRVTFSENVNITAAGWTVKINSPNTTVTAVSGSGTVWDFTTLATMNAGDNLFLNYDATTGGSLDYSGNEFISFVLFPIENVIISTSTFVGYLNYYSVNPYHDLSTGIDIVVWPISGTFFHNGPMSFSITTVPTGKWVAVKEPSTEPEKTTWYNTAFNNGTFGDSVFHAPVVSGGFRYYISRNPIALNTAQPLNIS